MKPAVSILVPIFNVQKYLRQCLESLVNQTLNDIEIILINDGSTDGSLSIVREYERRDHRIVVIDKQNTGYGDSMNRGLALATGDYIGIVEPDDFADLQMFEKLWTVAKSYDVDVVKSNYFAYSTSGECGERSDFVEALSGCQYDVVFEPVESQEVFLRSPSIWSALYRRAFLEREDVRFLPTPGASFQDTAFFFKSLYSATSMVLVQEGFIHYRIDNDGSSVKSQAKVFPICDEYAEIWRYAQRDSRKFEAIKRQIVREQFGGYLWNLERLAPQVRHMFFCRMVEEYRQISAAGLLDKSYFDGDSWSMISKMLANPQAYFSQTYGPEYIENTVIACLSSLDDEEVIDSVRCLLDISGESDEIILVHGRADELVRAIKTKDARAGRVYGCSDLFTSTLLFSVDLDRIRGERTTIVCAIRKLEPKDFGSISEFQRGTVFSFDKRGVLLLSDSNARLFSSDGAFADLPLAIIQYVLSTNEVGCLAEAGLGLLGVPIPPASVQEYSSAAEQLISFSHIFATKEISYELAREAYQLLLPFWNRVRAACHTLSAIDLRELYTINSRMASASALVFDSEKTNVTPSPQISVIIPVDDNILTVKPSLESVLDQDFRDFEILLINNGTTGNALYQLESIACANERIRLVSQLPCGRGAACNRGISFARGRTLMFVESGDTLPSNRTLSELWNGLRRSDSRICGGSLGSIDRSGCSQDAFTYKSSFYISETEKDVPILSIWSDYGWHRCLYDAALFQENRQPFPDLIRYDGPVFFLEAMRASGSIHIIPDTVYLHRLHDDSRIMNAAECRDFLAGILINLRTATDLDMAELYTTLISRIEGEFYEDIIRNIANAEVLQILSQIQGEFRPDLVLSPRISSCRVDLIRPLAHLTESAIDASGIDEGAISCSKASDQAVVRLAKRIAGTRVYKGLQSAIWHAKAFKAKMSNR